MKKEFESFNDAVKRVGPSIPKRVSDPWIWVHDTLWLAKIAAVATFGEEVTPEVVLAVYDRMVSRMEAPNPEMFDNA